MTYDAPGNRLLDDMIVDFARHEGHGHALRDALYIFSAITNAGLMVLPSEPTPAMLEAGAAAGGVSPDKVRAILRALTNAAV